MNSIIVNFLFNIIKIIDKISLPAYDIYTPLKIILGSTLVLYAMHGGVLWFYLGVVPLIDGIVNLVLFYIFEEEVNIN